MSLEYLREILDSAAKAKAQELARLALARTVEEARAEESLKTHSNLLARANAIMRAHEAVASKHVSKAEDAKIRSRLSARKSLCVTRYTDWTAIPKRTEDDAPLTAQLLVHTPYSRPKSYDHLSPYPSEARIEVVFRDENSENVADYFVEKDVKSVRADNDPIRQASFLYGNPDSVKDSLQLIEGALGIVQDS